jgi:hypothetical protein
LELNVELAQGVLEEIASHVDLLAVLIANNMNLGTRKGEVSGVTHLDSLLKVVEELLLVVCLAHECGQLVVVGGESGNVGGSVVVG